MKLYEIDEAILNCIDTETGEILDVDALSILEMERESKVESVALWYKQEKADAAALKEEIANLTARKKSTERKMESLKNWLAYALEGRKFKTPRMSISYRKSTTMTVEDPSLVPADYKTEETVEKIDTTQLKKDLISGMDIKGAILEQHNNLSVK